jgi:hypothetical protein
MEVETAEDLNSTSEIVEVIPNGNRKYLDELKGEL